MYQSFCLRASLFIVDLLTITPNFFKSSVFSWTDSFTCLSLFNDRMKFLTYFNRKGMKILLLLFPQNHIFDIFIFFIAQNIYMAFIKCFKNYPQVHKIQDYLGTPQQLNFSIQTHYLNQTEQIRIHFQISQSLTIQTCYLLFELKYVRFR